MAQVSETQSKAYIVVRVRGTTRIRGTIADTMKLLNVHAANNATVVPVNPVNAGMLNKVKDYVTWGEADRGTLVRLLRERGSVEENKELEAALRDSPHKTLDAFVDGLMRGEAKLRDVPGLRPTFRMNPPHQGWGTIKRSVKAHGSLGYRGADINDVIDRMLKAAGGKEATKPAPGPPVAQSGKKGERKADTKGGH